MDFRRLEVFQKVFELRSFSRAGQVLLLAQPTVSEHIRLLEEDLKLTLLDRQGREVVPTRAGELLYGYSKQLTGLRQEALRVMQQFLDKGRGELLIGGSNIPGQYLLPGILGKFKEKYPHIRVQVLIDDTRNMVEKVLAGAIELGVVGARVEHRQISCHPPDQGRVGRHPAGELSGRRRSPSTPGSYYHYPLLCGSGVQGPAGPSKRPWRKSV